MALLLDNDTDASCINNRSESPAPRGGTERQQGNPQEAAPEGADINVTDNEGQTLLICLLDNKRTDAALFLMDQGSRYGGRRCLRHKAIDYATAHGLRKWSPDSHAGMTGMHVATPRFIRPCITDRVKLSARCSCQTSPCLTRRMTAETPLILLPA